MKAVFIAGLLVACHHYATAIPIRSMIRQTSSTNSTIEWASCGDDAPASLECAQFEVPLNWAEPSGQQITLGMSRIRATNNATRIGSLIFNPGGPGGAATDFCLAQASGRYIWTEELTSHYDILCPDPRGVGTSNPIRCNPDLWNTRQTLFPKDSASYDQLVDTYRAFGQSCLDLSGDLVRYVDTVSVARDFEAIRVALGEGKLNYLGESYGTQIGTTYAELFPENIRLMALDGMLDHSASETYFLITESETYENELNRFFDWCNVIQGCALHGQNVSQIFEEVIAQAEDTPIPAPGCLDTSNSSYAGSCFPNVTSEDIRFNAQSFLISKPGGWLSLGRALNEASQGNATILSSTMATSENATIWQGLIVGCLDWHASSSFADNMYKQQLTASVSHYTRGAAQSYTYEAQCAGWPVPISNPQHTLNATAMALTPQLLLVNSYYDPSTSYTWANSVKEQVPNGVLLTRDGDGHTSYLRHGNATLLIDEYLVLGTLPAQNTVVAT